MKKFFWRILFFLVTFFYSIYGSSQPAKDCIATCFSTEVVSVEEISPLCRRYELKVSFSGKCDHALSHYSISIPCGEIKDIANSENWKQVIGTDPTTGLSGLKIDDIQGFGETSVSSFNLNFTVCASGQECSKDLKCWQPIVAYKASTCVAYETVGITCKSLKASLAYQDAYCFGAADGSLSVVVEDGQEPFTYYWSNQATGQSISGLAAGNYSVTIKDAAGSEVTLDKDIAQPDPILIEGQVTAALCNGLATGAIDIAVSGGTTPYSFVWSTGSATEDITQLASGSYKVTVTDGRGCSASEQFTVSSTTVITLSTTIAKPDCNRTNGSIDLTATGGAAPYTFQWSNGSVTEDIADVGPGLYSVTVTDNAGCSVQKSVLVRENNTLIVKGVPTSTSCTGDATGSINVTVSGGTAPYTFTWSNGATTEDISNLPAGHYTLKVEDSGGCFVTATFSLAKATFQVPRTIIQPLCYGDENGSIRLNDPIGGTGPYTYQWSNGATGTMLTGLASGSYSVIVTDATGCSRTFSMVISSPTAIAASATVSPSGCNVDRSYGIDLIVSGGIPPYTYNWSNGATTEDITGVSPGTFTVIVTDANGCTTAKEVNVLAQDALVSCVIQELQTLPVCGTTGNTLFASVTDADSYSWSVISSDNSWSITSPNSSSVTFTAGGVNTSATFTLTISRNGCTNTCSYVVSTCSGEGQDGEKPVGEEPGSENPGEEVPGEDGGEGCHECMNTTAILVAAFGDCKTYEMNVSTSGLCQYDLSHWTLSLPCGEVSDLWNSAGWPMVIGKDPTTGVYGLKVDNIHDFGKQAGSFTVRFTICQSNSCDTGWNPIVAYKAGQCVATENIVVDQPEVFTADVAAYPNPFNDMIRFEWRAAQEGMSLDIIDQYGNVAIHSTKATRSTDSFYVNIESSSLPRGMYYYRLTIDGKTYNGKISKR